MPRLRSFFIYSREELEAEYNLRRSLPPAHAMTEEDHNLLEGVLKLWVIEGGELVLNNPSEPKRPTKMTKRQVLKVINAKTHDIDSYTFSEKNPSDLSPTKATAPPNRVWVLDSLFSLLPKLSDVSNTLGLSPKPSLLARKAELKASLAPPKKAE